MIIDGTNLEFRVFYISRKSKTENKNGEPTYCIDKFLVSFEKIVNQFDPTNIYAAWDKKLTWPSSNFRKELTKNQYKAGRHKPADIQEMFDQEVKLIEMLEALGVRTIYPNVLEADDVCAWLSKKLEGSTVIVSVDQDFLQLVSPTVSVYNLKDLITYDNFKEKKGIKPELFKLYKAIKGDQSDNIPGLEGYGEVRSKKLAENWEDSNVTDEINDMVEKNLKLIDLHYGYKFQEGEEKAYEEQFNYVKNVARDIDKFKSLCEKYNFANHLNNIDRWKRLTNRNSIVDIINKLT
jgi:DNA polymerase-1